MKIFLTEYRTACTEKTELIDDILYPQQVNWFADTYRGTNTGLVYAPHKLADKVLDRQLLTHLKETKRGKTAFLLASGNAHFAGIQRLETKTGRLSYTYKVLPLSLTQVYAGRIAQACGANDYIATDATACVSSLKVLMDVQTLLKMYGFSRVVVLGVEDAVSPIVLNFFGESGACLTKEQEDTGIVPSAFDDHNFGFHVGQGAVLAVFEREDSLTLSAKAELVGAWTAGEELPNSIGQREDGQGYQRAIDGVLDFTGVKADQVKVIKTHGTGTKSNNVAEKSAICSRFTDFVATSFKQKIGHTMGASGLLETALMVDASAKGIVPAIANKTSGDDRFLSEPTTFPDGFLLSLSAGMGNIYSAAIFNTKV
jgi:3-oxoacyl-(acyl-carrier-protein) synthase